MITICRGREVPTEAMTFGLLLRGAVISKDRILAIRLGGSHAKGLSNRHSDYDIQIYYMRPIQDLFSLRPGMIEYKRSFHEIYELKEGSGTSYLVDKSTGNEFEAIHIPVWAFGSTSGKGPGKQFLKQIARQNGDYLYKLFVSLPIYTHPQFEKFMEDLKVSCVWSAGSLRNYFYGYLKSQVGSTKRARDFDRAMQKALDGSVGPIVKQTIEGINIGLNGLSFLAKGEFYRDFELLLERVGTRIFELEEYKFIRKLFKHKIDQLVIPANRQFFSEVKDMRARIFSKLSEKIDKQSSIWPEELTGAERRRNLDLLTRHLSRWYSITA